MTTEVPSNGKILLTNLFPHYISILFCAWIFTKCYFNLIKEMKYFCELSNFNQ